MGQALCSEVSPLEAELLEDGRRHGLGSSMHCCAPPLRRSEQHEEKIAEGGKLATRRAGSRRDSASKQGPLEPIKPRGSKLVLNRRGSMPGEGAKARGEPSKTRITWSFWRPLLMTLFVAGTVVASAYFEYWNGESRAAPSLHSALCFGSIPVVAAIIGYGTNVAALIMMFYPLEFAGCLPWLRIGCGLDLPLFGWQGVIPMKARQMAEISVDLMTKKLVKVEEIFNRMEPRRVAAEVADLLPDVLPDVLNEAGRKHCPKLWEHMPQSVHKMIEEKVVGEAEAMMARFVMDMQRNIGEVFDLKACAVEALVANPQILNDIFLVCGAEEFDFIRTSGFYLGFLFGILQMLVWLFCRQWWILPACGIVVGYYTNVIALKVIFYPVEPRRMCCGCLTIQGLFLKRQKEVSALYGEQIAEALLTPDVLLDALLQGPRREQMRKLVSKQVARCMEDQSLHYKPFFLLSNGAENWADFRDGVCDGFWERMPRLLGEIKDYMREAIELQATLQMRLEALPARDFERLLHAVFEQDEIKLVLVGALLGAIVGMLQAVAQTPEQLGLPPLF